ncbi:hypothetical protein GQ53DRAFT_463220 [Thozetella sp. PMI_491]|nr:hypothetical protein GQ53DRAFT_463220 [Thozetella sp. PMI_491]
MFQEFDPAMWLTPEGPPILPAALNSHLPLCLLLSPSPRPVAPTRSKACVIVSLCSPLGGQNGFHLAFALSVFFLLFLACFLLRIIPISRGPRQYENVLPASGRAKLLSCLSRKKATKFHCSADLPVIFFGTCQRYLTLSIGQDPALTLA